ncbi:hypothetical protein GCM10008905_29100 [Clostridium malenominatum]|uniref:Lipoprotein n=1 Tax=Clostridium malenominatum TaxID=1539 RepID=A0ABN1J5B5_9CLOT
MSNSKLMNKFKILLFIMMLMSFTACTKEGTKGNTKEKLGVITEAKLSPNEEALVKPLSDKYFIFEGKLNTDEYKWVELWVDYYEKGKLQSKAMGFGSSIEDKKEMKISFIIQKDIDTKDNKEIWNLSVIDGGGYGSAKTSHYKTGKANMSSWQSAKNLEIKEEDPVVLAAILESHGDSMNSLTEEFFQNPDKYKNKLEEYDYAYILKCRFSKEKMNYEEKLRIEDIVSMEIKFDDTLKETYRKENNSKEIESFINAYNSSTPFLEEEKEKGHINVVIKLENGGEIYFNGGNNKYIKVNKDGRERKITGEDIIKIFENFSGQFNND